MRAVFGVGLCIVLGACATFGGGEPEVYGTYDVISVDGAKVPYGEYLEGWLKLRPNGISMFTMVLEGSPGAMEFPGTYILEESEDGCIPFRFVDNEHPTEGISGTICGDEMTAHDGRSPMVLHKRW